MTVRSQRKRRRFAARMMRQCDGPLMKGAKAIRKARVR